MSRFKPSGPPSSAVAPFPYESPMAPVAAAPEVPVQADTTTLPAQFSGRQGPVHTLGFLLLCLSMIAGYANEWAMRLIGGKAYISTALVVLLPAIWLMSGNRIRGMRHRMGVWWVIFLLCLLIDAPFSVWRTGTLNLLLNYLPRGYLLFFIVTAFACDLKRCRAIMFLSVITSAMVLVTCFKYGVYDDDGRLRIADSLFFSNSNDLALGLLLGIVQFTFLFYEKSIFKWIFGVLCITLSVVYLLRTGSRGCFLALLAYGLLIFIISKKKAIVVLLAVAVGVVGIATLPAVTLSRLMLLGGGDDGTGDVSAIGSTLQRKELFKRSIQETLTHPIFGVGPGQFAVAVAGAEEKKGERSAWLGTHNSYTQVSAECGIPALICYCAVLLLCFRLNYSLYRATRDRPAYKEVAALTFTLLSATLVYSVATFFFHMAYTGNLPWVSGMTVAVYFAVKPSIQRDINPKFK